MDFNLSPTCIFTQSAPGTTGAAVLFAEVAMEEGFGFPFFDHVFASESLAKVHRNVALGQSDRTVLRPS